jgi:Fe-Mn family superoxide dismutase
VAGSGGLKVISTHDADDLLAKDGLFPLLVCDLWEHAYYLDYQNDRKAFLQRWIGEVANWTFAGDQLSAANGQGQGFRYPSANRGGAEREAPGDRPQA